MKKLSLVLAVGAIIAFASCKKEFTCTCVDGLVGTPYDVTAKGKTAAEACADESSVLKLKVCTVKQ